MYNEPYQSSRNCQKENWPYLIVLEDDIVLAEDFEKRINFLFKIIPSNWEHIYLSGFPSNSRKLDFKPVLEIPNIVPSIPTSGTFSMMIKNIAYEKIINKFSKFETTTDDILCKLIQTNKLISYTYYPFLTYHYSRYTYIWNKEEEKGSHPSIKYFKNKLL
jgi:GR25 family glycosyltransferase involved in LPS biosynthesis